MSEFQTAREIFEMAYDTRERRKIWTRLLRDAEGPILDIGCCATSPLDDATKKFTVSADLARNLLIVHKSFRPSNEHIAADVVHPPFRAQTFGTVAMPYVLDHIGGMQRKTNVRKAISEMLRASKKTVLVELGRDSAERLREVKESLRKLKKAKGAQRFTYSIHLDEFPESVFIRIEKKAKSLKNRKRK